MGRPGSFRVNYLLPETGESPFRKESILSKRIRPKPYPSPETPTVVQGGFRAHLEDSPHHRLWLPPRGAPPTTGTRRALHLHRPGGSGRHSPGRVHATGDGSHFRSGSGMPVPGRKTQDLDPSKSGVPQAFLRALDGRMPPGSAGARPRPQGRQQALSRRSAVGTKGGVEARGPISTPKPLRRLP
jgi:hypothetical protein